MDIDIYREHSDEAKRLLSTIPKYVVRIYILFIFLLLIFIGMLTWWIKYPVILSEPCIIYFNESEINKVDVVINDIDKFSYDKIAEGAIIIFKLEDYPYGKNGALRGKIDSIRYNNTGCILKVGLTDGMVTTFGNDITYQKKYSGLCEITTDKISLYKIILHKIKYLI